MNLYHLALNMRMYLVQENGPTKLVLEEHNSRKKYKVQIGYEITCSCGGAKQEHCVHTVILLLNSKRYSPL